MFNSGLSFSSKGRRALTALAATALLATSVPFAGGAVAGQAGEPAGGEETDAGISAKKSPALKAVERGLALVSDQEAKSGKQPQADAAASLARQRLNLETTKQILEYRDKHPGNKASDILGAARLAMIRQAAGLGIRLPAGGAAITELSPGKAALKLLARYEMAPSEAERQNIAELDRIPEPLQKALGRYMSAFLAFDQATRDTFVNVDRYKAPEMQRELQALAGNGSQAGSSGASLPAKTRPAQGSGGRRITGIDRVLATRLSMFVAAEDLDRALKAHPIANSPPPQSTSHLEQTGPGPKAKSAESPAAFDNEGQDDHMPSTRGDGAPPASGEEAPSAPPAAPAPGGDPAPGGTKIPETPVPLRLSAGPTDPELSSECQFGVSPAFCVDLRKNTAAEPKVADNTYKFPYALQIDAGGDDCYSNNAGGSGILSLDSPPASDCGKGAVAPVMPHVGGAGALLDLGGNDAYRSQNSSGGNGGASSGAGFLADLGPGNDQYLAEGRTPSHHPFWQNGVFSPGGLNGGAGNAGVGFIFDEGGDDRYLVKTEMSNGCAAARCSIWATNGGAWLSGIGFIFDGLGSDRYVVSDALPPGACPATGTLFNCSTVAANGGGFRSGSGSLIDLGGQDIYNAAGGGTNGGGYYSGSGLLLDLAGADIYEAGDYATNGGAFGDPAPSNPPDPTGVFSFPGSALCYARWCPAGLAGFLFDAAGPDEYDAGKKGTNGGGDAGLAGLLIDAGGFDSYEDDSGPLSSDADGKNSGDGYPSGDGFDKTVLPKGDGAQLDENSSADLAISISDSTDPAPGGRNLTYTATVTNHGLATEDRVQGGAEDPPETCEAETAKAAPGPHPFMGPCDPPSVHQGPSIAYDVRLSDQLPAGVNFTEARPSSGTCSYSDGKVSCRLGDLAEGRSATVEIVVTPHNNGERSISNTAWVASSTTDPDDSSDPNKDNNRATEETRVVKGQPVRSVSISDAAVVKEGSAGTHAAATFIVSLSGPPSDSPVSVEYSTLDRTAKVSDNDYEHGRGVIQFEPGETDRTATVPVRVNGDDISEVDETFSVGLSRPANAIVDRGHGKGTIGDDDDVPAISVGDVAVQEGNSVTLAEFTLSLSEKSGQSVSVSYATADGTATVADDDYRPAGGTTTFSPGETIRDVGVVITTDGYAEPDETFFLNLARPQNATINREQGVGRILNDGDTGSRPAPEPTYDEAEVIDPGSYSYQDGERASGGLFVTGHDADDHAAREGVGARRIIQAAVNYVTGEKSAPRILYITSDVYRNNLTAGPGNPLQEAQLPPAPDQAPGQNGEAAEEDPDPLGEGFRRLPRSDSLPRGMTAAGFTYDVGTSDPIGAYEPGARVRDLRTVAFSEYDVVVVGCVSDCMLTQQELDILNSRTSDVFNYVNAGGGLVVFEEGGPPKLRNTFGFLPFLRASTSVPAVIQEEKNFRVTDFGKSLGLTDPDVNGAISHNVFLDRKGMGVVDVDGQGRIMSLATRRFINARGALVDERPPPIHRPLTEERPGDYRPTDEEDGLPRPGTDAALKAAAIFQGDGLNQLPPPAQPVARPDHAGVARDPVAQQMPQSSAQTQTQMQLQSHQQAQQEAQTQKQMQVQVQSSPMKQQERQAQVQVARAEVGTDSAGEGRATSKAREHLATARRPVSPAGAVLGGMSALILCLLGLARPNRQKSVRTATLSSDVGRVSTVLRQPAPRHRKR